MAKYVLVPFSSTPAQFTNDILKMRATKVVQTENNPEPLSALNKDDQLFVMGHCGATLTKLYSARSGACAEIGAEAIVKQLSELGLRVNWNEIVLIACEAEKDRYMSTCFANSFRTALSSKGFLAKVVASDHEVAVRGGTPREVLTWAGQKIAVPMVDKRAAVVPIGSGSGRRPAH